MRSKLRVAFRIEFDSCTIVVVVNRGGLEKVDLIMLRSGGLR